MADRYMTKGGQAAEFKKERKKVGKQLKAHKKDVADRARKAIKKGKY